MIISHKLKFIYVRLRKVGSSSFEAAIKGLCGRKHIIGIGILRRKGITYLGKNYKNLIPVTANTFSTHITARELQFMLPEEMWDDYLKVATIRCPYDMVISLYYDNLFHGKIVEKSFRKFVIGRGIEVLKKIYGLHNKEGKLLTDFLIRYEHLAADIAELEIKIGCPDILKEFQGLMRKGEYRPKAGASSREIYSNYPDAKLAIDDVCCKWADQRYEFFEKYWPMYKADLEQAMSQYKNSAQS